VGFTLELSACVDHADKWKDALEHFDDFILNAIAGLGFVVGLATEAVFSVWIQGGSTLTLVVGVVVDDMEA
jgi:hypothetical protein